MVSDDDFESLDLINHRFILFRKNGKVGLMDFNLNVILNALYISIMQQDDYFIVSNESGNALINQKGTQIVPSNSWLIYSVDLNFLGVIDCVKAIEEFFKNKKSGHISIVSSIAGYRGLPNSSGYGPSKAALTNFSESIYFDFKKFGVRVSIVSPGFIKTPLTDKNEFPMPFLKTPEYAAEKIFYGLVKSKSFEIHFPKGLTLTLKFLRILPYKMYLFLVDKLVKR